MTLVVEDGTGVTNADSYISIASADTYHTAMGNPAWGLADDADKEPALRRATQYVDTQYQFRGSQLTSTQALAWPRSISGMSLDWPIRRLSNAVAELALRALDEPLQADIDTGEVKRETVGPLTLEYSGSGLGGQTRFTAADKLLAPFTAGGGSLGMRIERAS